jgi:hypothetical protein
MDSLLRREIKTALINRRSEDEATKSHPLGRSMLQWWTQKGYMLASGPSSWMKVTAIAMAGCLVSGLESWASGTRPHTAKNFHLNIWISLCLSRNPHIQWNDFCFIYKKSIAMVSLYSFTVNIYMFRISSIVSHVFWKFFLFFAYSWKFKVLISFILWLDAGLIKYSLNLYS